MIDDAMAQKDLIAALNLENLFTSQQLGQGVASTTNDLSPTAEESERAVSSIRAWRSYLPAACVQKMIDEGWQWSA